MSKYCEIIENVVFELNDFQKKNSCQTCFHEKNS